MKLKSFSLILLTCLACAGFHGQLFADFELGGDVIESSAGNIYFDSDDDGTNDVVINGQANVGIGTLTPEANLHVIGNAQLTGWISTGGDLDFGTGSMLVNDGSAALPTVAFTNDRDTGLYLNSTGNVAFATAGAARFVLHDGGNFGLGTTVPEQLLHVKAAGGNLFAYDSDGALSVQGDTEESERWGYGATAGSNSTALGYLANASGISSVALGEKATASGEYSTAIGQESLANASGTSALGQGASATGVLATALGRNALALADGSTVVGVGSLVSAANSTVIGYNLTASSNSMTIIGNVLAASGNGVTAIGYNASATGENSSAVGVGATASALESSALGYNATASAAYATAVGKNATASAEDTLAIGVNAMANEKGGTAIGKHATAGGNSISIGNHTTSSDNAIVIGHNSTASANSIIIGFDVDLSGYEDTMVFGNRATVTGNNQLVFGSDEVPITEVYIGKGVENTAHNDIVVHGTSGSGTDITGGNLIFAGGRGTGSGVGGEIVFQTAPAGGAGTTPNDHVTKMVIDSNGNVGVGTTAPTETLTIAGNLMPSSNAVYSTGNTSLAWNNIFTSNLVNISDKRRKRDIVDLDAGLPEILKLNPVSFSWKNKPQAKSRSGFLAQEIRKVLPLAVRVGDHKDDLLGVRYFDIVPVLVNALQDQQRRIEALRSEEHRDVETQLRRKYLQMKQRHRRRKQELLREWQELKTRLGKGGRL